jgi:hypothetical protein
MIMDSSMIEMQATVKERPALAALITSMGKLSRPKRNEIARLGRRAKAGKVARLRRLTREANAEARRWLAAKAAR